MVFTPASPLMVKQLQTGTGIFNLFSIGYAVWPHLRDRLTLRRLTLLRKPEIFGGQIFHLSYRYLCRHLRFYVLQHASLHTFVRKPAFTAVAHRMLLYHNPLERMSTASVQHLSPENYRR
jgi:hypothetical protein